MPVTAKLSKHFYDTFGDKAVNELADWMNAVDLSYRADLLQINEANVARFEANADARAAVLRGEMDKRFAELRGEMDRRFAELRGEMDKRFAELRGEMATEFAAVRNEMAAGFAAIDTRFAQFEARMLRWMLVFWTGTMIGAAATVIAVIQTR